MNNDTKIALIAIFTTAESIVTKLPSPTLDGV
jgi:hypothetical protein